MPQEQPLTEKQSLQLITDMINKTNDSFHETGFGPIMWGGVITLCSLLTFCSVQFQFSLPFDVWLLTLAALVPQVIYSLNARKRATVKTYNDVAMDYTWVAFGISIFVLTIAINTIAYDLAHDIPNYRAVRGSFTLATHTTSLHLMLYAIPTFVTGGIMKYKPMLWGGIVCWVLSVVSNFTPLRVDMLLMATAATTAWLVPGLMLHAKYRKYRAAHV